MATTKDRNCTHLAGEYFVAAELSKRGYSIGITMGNAKAIDVIAVADYIDLVANGILTNEETIEQNPELVQGFVNAFLRGLADTLADPDAAYEISKQYVEGLGDDRRGVLEASLPLWQAEQPGHTDPAAWQQTQDILIEMGLLDGPLPDLDQTYTNQFVEAAD